MDSVLGNIGAPLRVDDYVGNGEIIDEIGEGEGGTELVNTGRTAQGEQNPPIQRSHGINSTDEAERITVEIGIAAEGVVLSSSDLQVRRCTAEGSA